MDWGRFCLSCARLASTELWAEIGGEPWGIASERNRSARSGSILGPRQTKLHSAPLFGSGGQVAPLVRWRWPNKAKLGPDWRPTGTESPIWRRRGSRLARLGARGWRLVAGGSWRQSRARLAPSGGRATPCCAPPGPSSRIYFHNFISPTIGAPRSLLQAGAATV